MLQKFFSFFFIFPLASLSALAIFNPADPILETKRSLNTATEDLYASLKIGYRGDFVKDRYLKKSDGISTRPFQINTNAGQATLTILNIFDFYGYIGNVSSSYTIEAINYTNDSTTCYGLGIKMLLGQWRVCRYGTSYLGFDAQYASNFNWEGRPYQNEPQEWQVSLGLAHRIRNFVPYIALSYARMTTILNEDSSLILTSTRPIGYIIGTSIVSICRMDVTAELRFGYEKATALSMQMRF